jgi:hypothetical protein
VFSRAEGIPRLRPHRQRQGVQKSRTSHGETRAFFWSAISFLATI